MPTIQVQLKSWQGSNPLRLWALQTHTPFSQTAVQIGVSYWAMRMWMAGQTRPNGDNMRAVARAMGVTVTEMEERWDDWLRRKPMMEYA